MKLWHIVRNIATHNVCHTNFYSQVLSGFENSVFLFFLCFIQTGHLELFDIAAGVMLENVEAHEGALWAIAVAPDKVNQAK